MSTENLKKKIKPDILCILSFIHTGTHLFLRRIPILVSVQLRFLVYVKAQSITVYMPIFHYMTLGQSSISAETVCGDQLL
jgi:hypothetical protein